MQDEEGHSYKVHSYKGTLNRKERVIGYIPLTEKDGFIRIVEKKKLNIILLLLLLTLLGTLFFGGLWLGSRQKEAPVLDEAAVAYNIEGMKNPDPEKILLPGIGEIHVKAKETHVEYTLMNVEGNECNLQYEILLDESEEVLYSSGQIKPGYAVLEFELKRPLEKGRYPITVQANSFDRRDPPISFNGGSVKATLVVE